MRHHVSVVAGLGLGLAVVIWQFVSIPAGLTPVFVPVAFGMQVLAVLLALWVTREHHGYGQQMLSSVELSAIASVMIFIGSLVAMTAIFPDAIVDLRHATAAQLAEADATVSEIEAATASITPIGQAIAGVVGTMVSGPLVAAIGAIWLRSKGVSSDLQPRR